MKRRKWYEKLYGRHKEMFLHVMFGVLTTAINYGIWRPFKP